MAAAESTTTISVNLWGSHPDEDNDDCWTGIDFASEAEARAWIASPTCPAAWRTGAGEASFLATLADVAYFQIGRDADERGILVDVIEVVRHEAFHEPKAVRRRAREEREEEIGWRREQAMQAGMGLGVEAYNDAMGW